MSNLPELDVRYGRNVEPVAEEIALGLTNPSLAMLPFGVGEGRIGFYQSWVKMQHLFWINPIPYQKTSNIKFQLSLPDQPFLTV